MTGNTWIGSRPVPGRYEPAMVISRTVAAWLGRVQEKFGPSFSKRCGEFFKDHSATLDKLNYRHWKVMERVVIEQQVPLSKEAVADHLSFRYDRKLGEAFLVVAEKPEFSPREALVRVKAMLAAGGQKIEPSKHPHINLYLANQAFDNRNNLRRIEKAA